MPNRLNSRSTAPHRLVAAALAAGAVLCSLPTLADGARTVGVPIHYAKASLQTEAGAHAVYAQINRAARAACGQPTSRSLSHVQEVQECRRQAVARAVSDISSPMLAAVHAREGAAPRLAGAGDLHTSR